tara:strand:+ start:12744 stop:13007 length:264 start_codon:yes stop_codon:yes gene_type:complete
MSHDKRLWRRTIASRKYYILLRVVLFILESDKCIAFLIYPKQIFRGGELSIAKVLQVVICPNYSFWVFCNPVDELEEWRRKILSFVN